MLEHIVGTNKQYYSSSRSLQSRRSLIPESVAENCPIMLQMPLIRHQRQLFYQSILSGPISQSCMWLCRAARKSDSRRWSVLSMEHTHAHVHGSRRGTYSRVSFAYAL